MNIQVDEKDVLKELMSALSQRVNRKMCHVVNTKMADIEGTWLRLKCVVQERVEHLAMLVDEVCIVWFVLSTL